MNKPINEAIALRYKYDEDDAPIVLAKGKGYVAEAILELAKKAGIPTLKEPELLKLLENVDIGEYIPPEAFPLTAELIAFIWRIEESIVRDKRD